MPQWGETIIGTNPCQEKYASMGKFRHFFAKIVQYQEIGPDSGGPNCLSAGFVHYNVIKSCKGDIPPPPHRRVQGSGPKMHKMEGSGLKMHRHPWPCIGVCIEVWGKCPGEKSRALTVAGRRS